MAESQTLPEQADQNHHPEALVRVTRTECRGRKENAGGKRS